MGVDFDDINKTTTTHLENVPPTGQLEDLEITKDAQQAAASEHESIFWQAIKENRKSVFWSAIISLTIIMEGYDVGKQSCYDCWSLR